MKKSTLTTGFLLLLLFAAGCHIYKEKGDLNGFSSDVNTILSTKCASCHFSPNGEGNFVIESAAQLAAEGYIVPGDATNSTLYHKVTSPQFGQRMPFGGPYLSKNETDVIAAWINTLTNTNTTGCVPHIIGGSPSFANDVKPLLNTRLPQNVAGNSCMGCHRNGGSAATKLQLSTDTGVTVTYANVMSPTAGLVPYAGPIVIPGDPCNSRLYMRVSQTTGPDAPWNQMPKAAVNKMTNAQLGIIYTWILDGAQNN